MFFFFFFKKLGSSKSTKSECTRQHFPPRGQKRDRRRKFSGLGFARIPRNSKTASWNLKSRSKGIYVREKSAHEKSGNDFFREKSKENPEPRLSQLSPQVKIVPNLDMPWLSRPPIFAVRSSRAAYESVMHDPDRILVDFLKSFVFTDIFFLFFKIV